jgi:polysaccharide export outer membrane protein
MYSNQDLIYLQKKDNSETEMEFLLLAKPYRLQITMCWVSVSRIDPKLVAILVPQTRTAGKSESGLYFDGFTVDDHGNIRMPVLENWM